MHRPGQGESEGGERPRRLGAVVALFVLALSLVRFGLELMALRMRCCFDFPAALEAVQAFAAGGPLYSPVLEDYAPGIGAFKYPPPYAILLLPFARVRTIEGALDAYLTFEILLYFAAVGLLAFAFRLAPGDGRGWALFLVILVLNLGPAFETLIRLQIELLLLLCFAVAALALRRGREGAAGAALAGAVMLKIYPIVAIAPFLVKRRWRALLGFGAGVCVLSILSVAVLGRAECERFVLGALPVMLRELPTNLYGAENASIARWLMHYADVVPPLARSIGTAVAATLLAVTILVTLRTGQVGAATPEEMALFVPVMLLALPNSWTNYQLLLLVPMAAILGLVKGRGLREGILPVGLVLVAALWLTYHMDTYYYPLAIHFPPRLSALLHDNRFLASLLTWVALLAVVATGNARGAGARVIVPPRLER